MNQPDVPDLGGRLATATITDLETFAVGSAVCWAVVAALGVVGEFLLASLVGGGVGLGGALFDVLVAGPAALAVASLGLAAAAEVYEMSTGQRVEPRDLFLDEYSDFEEQE